MVRPWSVVEGGVGLAEWLAVTGVAGWRDGGVVLGVA